MRFILTPVILLVAVACGGDDPSAVSTTQAPAQPVAQAQGVPGVAQAGGNGFGSRPINGSGTPGNLTAWTATDVLGDGPVKVADNGDLIVRPGTAIILTSADGTKCWRLSGEGFQKLTPNCPTY